MASQIQLGLSNLRMIEKSESPKGETVSLFSIAPNCRNMERRMHAHALDVLRTRKKKKRTF